MRVYCAEVKEAGAVSFDVVGDMQHSMCRGAESPYKVDAFMAIDLDQRKWGLVFLYAIGLPHTRILEDKFALPAMIIIKDEKTACDLWREQPIIKLPRLCILVRNLTKISPKKRHCLAKVWYLRNVHFPTQLHARSILVNSSSTCETAQENCQRLLGQQ
jgi:hypothetical protein